MAASVAVVQGRAEFQYVRAGKNRISPSGSVPAASLPTVMGKSREESQRDADESVRTAMYLSCWGPS